MKIRELTRKLIIIGNMKEYKFKGYSKWKDIMNNSKITDIQDPILEMEVDKHEFEDMYSDIVSELNGTDNILHLLTFKPLKN